MQITAIILVNYRREEDTLECLDSLGKVKSGCEVRIYVVDVLPASDNVELAEHPVVHEVITLEENLGFTGANNVAMERALEDGADVVVLLNNDTTVEKHFLDPLVKMATKKGVGLVSPKIYFYPGREYHVNSYKKIEQGKVLWYAGGIIDWANVYAYHQGVDEVDHGQFGLAEETDFNTGCCVVASKETVNKVGLLDDKYFFGWEDVDWSMRASKEGLKLKYEPKSVIWHKNAGSSGGSGSTTHQYYQNRNRILFGMRYAGWRAKLALIKESLRKMINGAEVEKRVIKDALLGRFGIMED